MTSLLLPFLLSIVVHGDEHNHIYSPNEQVVLWMNTIGPYRNRQETYPYFSLPFCRGPKQSVEHFHETLGEAISGIEREYSGIDIRYRVNVEETVYCQITIDHSAYKKLSDAITNQYWYQMDLDELPIWSVVGEMSGGTEPYIWTHKEFTIGFNKDQIVKVTLVNSKLIPLKEGKSIDFSYSVKWEQSSILFNKRFNEYLDYGFFKHRVHWFSIFNSFMMVFFLVVLVCMILLRTLRRDYARYNKEEGLNELDRELGDEYGWKQVHGDVFRKPPHPTLLASLVGTGAHVAVASCIVLLLALANQLYAERGGFISTAIFVFAAAAPINGLVGGSLYSQLSGRRWIRQFLLGSILLPFLICCAAFLVNLVAAYYHTSWYMSILTMLAVVAIVLFVVIPLNLVGTVLGRNLCGQSDFPCRVSPVPRPIPEKKWFMEPSLLVLLGGILPFGSIFIELYFIFTSFWAYKIYFVFGFTLLVLLLLMVVTSSVSAVSTYFLLNSEDYRWQWTSFLSGASIALYAYLYSTFYFIFKTKMSGVFQTTFFFSYMAVFSLCLGIMCGAVAYLAASRFVRKIYSTVKVD